MPTLAMRIHTYEGDGHCVYCREPFPREQLEDEHIIPEALHGTLVIRRGACKPCARRSNEKYENQALNADLQVPRLLLQLRGKGTGKPPIDIRHLPPVYAGDVTVGELGERLGFPVEDYPRHFSLVAFPQAGLLAGVDRGGDLTGLRLIMFNIGGRGLQNVTSRQKRVNGPFAMMLAKIAYCYAMAEKRDFDGSDIRDLLLGKRDDVYNFVGSLERPEPLSNRHFHALYFRTRGAWLTVLVHLFASCSTDRNAMPYEVVVGKAQ